MEHSFIYLFMFYVTSRQENDEMNNELERMWKEVVMS
jgi:hypothetical protein